MDKKKELLLKVLNKLLPYRNLAEGLVALVDSKYIDEKTIDGLLLIINQSIKNVKEGKEKTKLMKAVEVVQKIKHSEKIEREDEAEEVERLLENM